MEKEAAEARADLAASSLAEVEASRALLEGECRKLQGKWGEAKERWEALDVEHARLIKEAARTERQLRKETAEASTLAGINADLVREINAAHAEVVAQQALDQEALNERARLANELTEVTKALAVESKKQARTAAALASAHDEIERLRADLASEREGGADTADTLRSMLRDLEGENRKLARQVDEQSGAKQIAKLEHKLAIEHKERQRLAKRIKTMVPAAEMEVAVADVKAHVARLKAERAAARKVLQQRGADFEILKSAKESLEAEVGALRARLEAEVADNNLEADNAEALQAEVAATRRREEQLAQRLRRVSEELEAVKARREVEVSAQADAASLVARLQHELGVVKGRLKEAEDGHAATADERLHNSRDHLSARAVLEETVNTLQAELVEEVGRFAELEAQLREVRAGWDDDKAAATAARSALEEKLVASEVCVLRALCGLDG